MDFILGTSSKSRKEVVDLLGWKYRQMSPDIDEKSIRSPDPYDLPILIAEAKAAKLMHMLKEEGIDTPKIIVTADQIVLFGDTIREKPINAIEAKYFLSSYSNNSVSTISAVVATHYPSGRQCSDVDVATVNWMGISSEIVEKVVAKGEIYSSAGGFRLEDPDLNPLIASIEGAVDSVLGMPVKLMISLITEAASYLIITDDELDSEGGLDGEALLGDEDSTTDETGVSSAARTENPSPLELK